MVQPLIASLPSPVYSPSGNHTNILSHVISLLALFGGFPMNSEYDLISLALIGNPIWSLYNYLMSYTTYYHLFPTQFINICPIPLVMVVFFFLHKSQLGYCFSNKLSLTTRTKNPCILQIKLCIVCLFAEPVCFFVYLSTNLLPEKVQWEKGMFSDLIIVIFLSLK